MADKMLIDATHPEETRVVVLRGNRVEEFDFESANRKQLRGNIYLAKVTRVEPSLQAAFVDYGGNRHGFLAFSEIHPDYYQIPVADRQALIAQEEHDQRAADVEADNRAGRRGRHRHRSAGRHRDRDVVQSEPLAAEGSAPETAEAPAGDTLVRRAYCGAVRGNDSPHVGGRSGTDRLSLPMSTPTNATEIRLARISARRLPHRKQVEAVSRNHCRGRAAFRRR